jgi:hypothetical protein
MKRINTLFGQDVEFLVLNLAIHMFAIGRYMLNNPQSRVFIVESR